MIIALGHRKQVGKDLVAKIIQTHLIRNNVTNVEIRSFAYLLKSLAYKRYAHLGLRQPSYYDNFPQDKSKILPQLNKSARDVWIELAKNIRSFDPQFFVHCLINSCLINDYVIIPDLRYSDEYKAIKAKNGIYIRIDRETNLELDEPDSALLNVEPDYILDNNCSIAELHNKVIGLLSSIIK